MKCSRKIIQGFAENRIFNLLWKYNAFVWCRDLGQGVCRNAGSAVYEDEPLCALLDDKYFKVIDNHDKSKITAKNQLCAQKCSAITETFQTTTNLKLKVRPQFLM